MEALEGFFAGTLHVHRGRRDPPTPRCSANCPEQARELCEARERWIWLRDHGSTIRSTPRDLAARRRAGPRPSVFRALQDYSLRVSWKQEVRDSLMQLFDGRAFDPCSDGDRRDPRRAC
jgi:hypothetical protein